MVMSKATIKKLLRSMSKEEIYAIEFTFDFGDMWEQYYESVEGNFAKTVEFIAKNGLWEKFDKRLQQCVSWASVCGYGFADGIDDIYEEARHRTVGE